VRYLVAAADPDLRGRVREEIEAAEFETVAEHPEGAGPAGRTASSAPEGAVDWGRPSVGLADDAVVVVSLGGDGSILYNARRFGEPTLLPVRTGDSVGGRIDVDRPEMLDRLRRLESGSVGEDYRLERHRRLGAHWPAEDGGERGAPVAGGFEALNDLHVHHGSPVRSAKFRLTVQDGDRLVYEADRVIGDGVLVATPFGSTGYFRSITGGSLREGVGVALNDAYRPRSAPSFWGLSPAARVRVRPLSTTAGTPPVLARDDDPEPRELAPGEPVSIGTTDSTVGVVRF